eukprot:764319-Hanusia_phi.AAC.1
MLLTNKPSITIKFEDFLLNADYTTPALLKAMFKDYIMLKKTTMETLLDIHQAAEESTIASTAATAAADKEAEVEYWRDQVQHLRDRCQKIHYLQGAVVLLEHDLAQSKKRFDKVMHVSPSFPRSQGPKGP